MLLLTRVPPLRAGGTSVPPHHWLFRYEVLTDDPVARKAVDDMAYDFYGDENPRPLEDYQNPPKPGMTFGGM